MTSLMDSMLLAAVLATGVSAVFYLLKATVASRQSAEQQHAENVRQRDEILRRLAEIERAVRRQEPGVARRELDFLIERVAQLERGAPLAVRCVPAEASDGDQRCPYCHGDIGKVNLVRCGRCEAKHHADCYSSHGRCAVFGCGAAASQDCAACGNTGLADYAAAPCEACGGASRGRERARA